MGVGPQHICVGVRRTCVGAQLSDPEGAETELSDPDGVHNADLGRIGVFGEKELEDQCLTRRWSSANKAVTCAWPLAQGGHSKGCLNWFIDVCSMLSNEEFTSMQSECVINININSVICKSIYSKYSVYRNLRLSMLILCSTSLIFKYLYTRGTKLYCFKTVYNTNKAIFSKENELLKCAMLKMLKLKLYIGLRRTVIGPRQKLSAPDQERRNSISDKHPSDPNEDLLDPDK